MARLIECVAGQAHDRCATLKWLYAFRFADLALAALAVLGVGLARFA